MGAPATIPSYLSDSIVRQDPSLYTPIDHAVWRFILKISQDFFADNAHQKYLDGLRETGISTERIPLIEDMDRCLQRFGWRAVAVSGFVAPAVFMEFLSLGILPIACDMRTQEHLAYTPAPDIVHEAAGHAPIIADPDYREYLRSYGEISRRAILSSQDLDVYEAIRHLSVVKEDPASTPQQIAEAQAQLDRANASVTYVSEATLLSRMGWWTFEYGLIGSMERPKIYGAGLLSSVGESANCLGPDVQRIPFSVDCIHTTYDITRPQPQLFVAPDFATLQHGLEALAEQMAYKRGGLESLRKAVQGRTVTTTVLDSGLQISGVLADVQTDSQGLAAYLKYQGPVQLSHADRELEAQGAETHADGYSTPLGKLRDGRHPAELSEKDWLASAKAEFASGVTVAGKVVGVIHKGGKTLVVRWKDCTVSWNGKTLYKPEWGVFDMACGVSTPSVFGGAADRHAYFAKAGFQSQEPGVPKTNLTSENRALNTSYGKLRTLREGQWNADSAPALAKLAHAWSEQHQRDWLLGFEILELARKHHVQGAWVPEIETHLAEVARSGEPHAGPLARGLKLL